MVVTIRQTVSSGSLPPAHTHLLSADENRAGWGSGDGVESAVGGGVGLLERMIFFSSGVKGGRSCVQSS